MCSQQRKRQLVARIVRSSPDKFITLTCRHERSPDEQWDTIRKALPKLAKRIRRRQEFEYVRMLERCADSFPHFHLLARTAYIEHAQLKRDWSELTDATIVDIRKAHGRSPGYVAKYIGKARDETGSWKRQHLSVSQRFWQDRHQENQLIGFNRRPESPWWYAEQHDEWAFERTRWATYWMHEREPGDDLPLELTPRAAGNGSDDLGHPLCPDAEGSLHQQADDDF